MVNINLFESMELLDILIDHHGAPQLVSSLSIIAKGAAVNEMK